VAPSVEVMAGAAGPRQLNELLDDSDAERARRAMEAMLAMGKIDIAELQRAADAG